MQNLILSLKHTIFSDMKGITNSIKTLINSIPKGEMFSFDDFLDYGCYDSVKKVLFRLEKSGDIKRVFDGIYVVPRISKLTGEEVPNTTEDIATYLAKKNCWEIVPSGLCCLNYLGLSTQVPANFEYVSDGPYRTYNIKGTQLIFKHTSPSELKNMSIVSKEVVQALKTLGKDNVTEKDITKLRNTLPNDDKKKLLAECKKVRKWIYNCIIEIAR